MSTRTDDDPDTDLRALTYGPTALRLLERIVETGVFIFVDRRSLTDEYDGLHVLGCTPDELALLKAMVGE